MPRTSAVVQGQRDAEPILMHTNHVNMVKYTSRQDQGFITISEHLQIMADAAVEKIRQQWAAERRANDARSNASDVVFTVDFSLTEVMGVDHFVAREEELARLHEVLGGNSPNRRTAVLQGLGGMGKTQSAIAYATRHRDDFSAIFWLNAIDEASLKQGFLRVAERILRQYPSADDLKSAVERNDLNEGLQTVKKWLDNTKNDRWLLIYDNYDNPLLGNEGATREESAATTPGDGADNASQAYDIRRFLPDAFHGAILITTRSFQVQLGHRISLKKLDNPQDGLEILSSMSNRQGLDKGNMPFLILLYPSAKRVLQMPLPWSFCRN